MKGRLLLLGLVSALSLCTALSVVYTKHASRKLFVELQELQQTRDELDIEWGQLQLEQSTWSTHSRIEQIAQRQLGMLAPEQRSVVIVKQ
ncbi:MAG: cell division protein FtsL [Thiotrichales bacterium SG8_50]|nr:MAG: cell division protein FtsL [Thiotrichales bacterium SG8_50]